ncbi:MAG: NVEALA domain-containing protein [Parabacteroides merdae]
MWHKPIDIRIIYPYIYLQNKSYEKRVSAVVIVLVCLGGVACIKTLSTSSVGLPQLAFDNIEALASGE